MELRYRIQRFLIKTFVRSYFRIQVHGLEHIPSSGPLILAANHSSFLDPPFIGLGVTRQVTYLAKEELFSVPLLGWWLRQVGSYPVARGKGDARILKTALRLLKEGKMLLIFPEGTRSPDGSIKPLESGMAWLALKAGVPVVPIYTPDTYRLMPKNARFPRPGRVQFYVSEPIVFERDEAVDFHEQVTALTMRVETALKAMEAVWREPSAAA